MRDPRLAKAALAPTLVFVMLAAAPAAADVGVSVGYGRLDLPRALAPGKSYELPPLEVINPGTETTSYRMGAGVISNQRELSPRAEWFAFSPVQLTLAPGRRRPVRVRLRIPGAARRGAYQVLVKAQVAQPGRGGATVGAAAAARVTFRVSMPGIGLSARPRQLRVGDPTRLTLRVRSAARRCRSGVVIRYAGRRVRTDRHGRATLVVRAPRAGVGRVVASKRGCRTGTAKLHASSNQSAAKQ